MGIGLGMGMGFPKGLIVSPPGAAAISISSVSPETSSTGLASRILLEFPILIRFACSRTTSCKHAHFLATIRAAVELLLWPKGSQTSPPVITNQI